MKETLKIAAICVATIAVFRVIQAALPIPASVQRYLP